MTRKAAFNAEEWTTVVDGPLLAGLAVSAAERGGRVRESLAIGRVYAEVRAHQGESELLDELVRSPPAFDPERQRQLQSALPEETDRTVRAAVALVGRSATPAELDAYKTFVMRVAQAVAGAHREGGFLGIGGRPVSAAEDAALDRIAAALGDPPAGALTTE